MKIKRGKINNGSKWEDVTTDAGLDVTNWVDGATTVFLHRVRSVEMTPAVRGECKTGVYYSSSLEIMTEDGNYICINLFADSAEAITAPTPHEGE